MTNNDELAQELEQTAVKANEHACFTMAVHTQQILDLLAERDADKKLLAELEGANASQDDHINQQQARIDALDLRNSELGKYAGKLESISTAAEKLVRCKGRYHSEQNYRALAALFGVTTPELSPLETEARTVSVKLPDGEWEIDHSAGRPILTYKKCSVIEAEDAYFVMALIAEHRAAAGFKLEVGE